MLLVISFVVFMLLGLPLFGVIGLASIISMIGMPFPMEFIPQNLYTGMDQFPLIATIGFVMAGFLMEPAGITGEIIEVAKKAVGNIRGGLAMVTILACMIFAALSGSGPATTAAIGSIMIPGMIAAGYRKDDAAAVSATGGTLGILIPPSNPMIIYGVVANTSIAGLFMAGFHPRLRVDEPYVHHRVLHRQRSAAIRARTKSSRLSARARPSGTASGRWRPRRSSLAATSTGACSLPPKPP